MEIHHHGHGDRVVRGAGRGGLSLARRRLTRQKGHRCKVIFSKHRRNSVRLFSGSTGRNIRRLSQGLSLTRKQAGMQQRGNRGGKVTARVKKTAEDHTLCAGYLSALCLGSGVSKCPSRTRCGLSDGGCSIADDSRTPHMNRTR